MRRGRDEIEKKTDDKIENIMDYKMKKMIDNAIGRISLLALGKWSSKKKKVWKRKKINRDRYHRFGQQEKKSSIENGTKNELSYDTMTIGYSMKKKSIMVGKRITFGFGFRIFSIFVSNLLTRSV